MIQTRQTIFDALRRLFRRLFKQADKNPIAFKDVMYAVILNDMKEWGEYIGYEVHDLEKILKNFLRSSKEFDISRFQEILDDYKNVNTPQSNQIWQVVVNNTGNEITPVPQN